MHCKNCNTALKNERYCPECGARIIKNRLTLKSLFAQINKEYLAVDNRFLRTIISLFTKPEQVIEGFISGQRKRYFDVIPFYAIALSVLGAQFVILKTFFPEFLIIEEPAALLAENNEKLLESFNQYMQNFINYQGILYSISMPFLAVGTWLMYKDKNKHNYTEHLVINLYTNSQLVFINALLFLIIALIGKTNLGDTYLYVSPLTFLYGCYVLKRIYNTSFINALLKYILAYIIYALVFFMVMMCVVILGLVIFKFLR